MSGGPGRVDQLDADRHDTERFAFGRVDLADVGKLVVAGGGRVDRGDPLMVEHLLERGVAGDLGDAGQDVVALAVESDQRATLMLRRLESLTRISVVLRSVAIRSK